MIQQNFAKLFEETYKKHWILPAFSNYEAGETYSFADVSKWVAKVHLILKHNGLQQGDKVALIGKDCAEWCMVWMGIVTYGAVVVPILPQFHEEDIRHIIHHSDSLLVFVGDEHEKALKLEEMPMVKGAFKVKDLTALPQLSRSAIAVGTEVEQLFAARYPNGFTKDDIHYPEVGNDQMLLISYTSGTSGFSKGVMATANNLVANIQFGQDTKLEHRGDNLLCFLPNAHAYSCAFNFLLPQVEGTHVYLLNSKPAPRILVKAFKELQPKLVVSVPLILEKIYKGILVPKLKNKWLSLALKTPIVKGIVHRKLRQALIDTFGGQVNEVIIGGAALNPEVEDFLLKIGFPVTVGYGMTECSPIISYAAHKIFKPHSAGRILHKIEEVRIAEPQEIEGKMIGEVQVRGENVCLGYYKNPEATAQLFTEEGWMRTGDLGYIEGENLYLKGRSKAMLLSSDGQNIYPEEIEAKLAMQPFVNDAILVSRQKRIVAIVAIDREALKKEGYTTDEAIKTVIDDARKRVNGSIAQFAQIGAIEILPGEFEKTPKQSIKRYLYH
ncbi:MAG: AMP-binding protein [Porphyromonas sp.]|nr:AMP-binding protein [Porphyromonas sp.]